MSKDMRRFSLRAWLDSRTCRAAAFRESAPGWRVFLMDFNKTFCNQWLAITLPGFSCWHEACNMNIKTKKQTRRQTPDALLHRLHAPGPAGLCVMPCSGSIKAR
jgi:hypothetical protein